MKSSIMGVVAGAMALLATSTAWAEPVTLKVASGAPEPTIWAEQLRRYKKKVEELSQGDIKLELFYAGQLGSMGDSLKSTLGGRVDMWAGSVPLLASVTPALGTLTFPFMFDNDDQARCAVPKMLDAAKQEVGGKYEFLTFIPTEHQALASSMPIPTPDVLKGRKVRSAPLQSSIRFFQSIGATPLALPAEETPSAASTGLIEAANFGLAYGMASGLMQTYKVYTRADLQFNLSALIVSASTWKKLDEKQQAILTEALTTTMEFSSNLDEIVAFENAMSAKLEQMGGSIVRLTPEQTSAWIDASRATWEESLKEMHSDATGFFKEIETAKAGCKS